MDDAISRQAVISVLDETKRIASHNIDGGVLMTFEEVLESLVNITNALPTIQPEPHWISCKDKLPPSEKKTYWVCLGNGSQCECRWTNDIYGFGEIEDRWGWSYLDKPQYSTIVAWRELPEPYTEEAE